MKKVMLGRTGLMVTRTAMGCLPIQRIDFDAAKAILRRAYDAGINFFDTANGYTDSEKKIGYALSDVRENIIIAALLHDICKANVYQKATKYRKDKNNAWETYDSYNVDYSELPLGHGEKSVIRLLQLGLQLTNDEILAIRWHMTAWELPFQSSEAKANLSAAKDQCPLLTIIQTADGLASAILEEKRK